MNKDIRIKPKIRTIALEIIDYTPIPFKQEDLEWIGEFFEDKLKERYDIKIDKIECYNGSLNEIIGIEKE